MPKKWPILESFLKPEFCGQKELPDMSVLKGQNDEKCQNSLVFGLFNELFTT